MKHNKRGICLMILGSMLLLGAVALFLYNGWQDKQAEKISKTTVNMLNKEIRKNIDSTDKVVIPKAMGTISVGNKAYIGTISIPSLNIELPVLEKWSYENLKLSPCVYKGNIYDNSMIVIAHNYESHFGSIGNLNPGDAVYFTDTKGHTHSFVVTDIVNMDGKAVEEMEKGSWDLTLFTCTYGGKQRVTVRCIRE